MSQRIHFSWDPKDHALFRLERAYTRETEIGKVTVPRGFRCDLASIIRQVRQHLPQWEDYTAAALIHDWLYKTQPCSRLQADNIFRALMLEDQVTYGRAKRMYDAVRNYGDSAWRGHQEQDEPQMEVA